MSGRIIKSCCSSGVWSSRLIIWEDSMEPAMDILTSNRTIRTTNKHSRPTPKPRTTTTRSTTTVTTTTAMAVDQDLSCTTLIVISVVASVLMWVFWTLFDPNILLICFFQHSSTHNPRLQILESTSNNAQTTCNSQTATCSCWIACSTFRWRYQIHANNSQRCADVNADAAAFTAVFSADAAAADCKNECRTGRFWSTRTDQQQYGNC